MDTDTRNDLQKILKKNIEKKPDFFLLGILEDDQEEKYGNLLLYMITAARMVYAQYWKKENTRTKEEWMMKLMELAQMAKLTILLKDKNISKFK